MKTRQELLEYALSVHKAIHGVDLLNRSYYKSDHPYMGYDIDTLQELVDPTLVKKQVKSFEAEIARRVEAQYQQLSIGTPVKVTKGSKDKRGMEGFIIHAQDPLQGGGKALFVYDVLTNKNCMVRSTSTKARLPSYGEQDILRETYQVCKDRAGAFTSGVLVELKADTTRKGYCMTDAQLDPNYEGNGFFQVEVQWTGNQAPKRGTYILTELNLT